jgi:hypothetical protein
MIPEKINYIKLLSFLTYPSASFLFETQRFGDWNLSPSSGKSFLNFGYIFAPGPYWLHK